MYCLLGVSGLNKCVSGDEGRFLTFLSSCLLGPPSFLPCRFLVKIPGTQFFPGLEYSSSVVRVAPRWLCRIQGPSENVWALRFCGDLTNLVGASSAMPSTTAENNRKYLAPVHKMLFHIFPVLVPVLTCKSCFSISLLSCTLVFFSCSFPGSHLRPSLFTFPMSKSTPLPHPNTHTHTNCLARQGVHLRFRELENVWILGHRDI